MLAIQPPTPPKVSQRQQARDLSARVSSMEEAMPQFMFATDRQIGVLQNQQSHSTEILNALVAIIGEEQVVGKIQELRILAEVKKAESRRARVLQALEEGKLEPEETVRGVTVDAKGEVTDLGSLIALAEFDPEGREIPYSYACVPVGKMIKPEHQKAVAGQKAGFELEIEFEEDGKPVGKGKMVLLGIYKRKEQAAAAPVKTEAASPVESVNTEAGEDPAQLDPASRG
jgi:hypothetical protein